MTIPEWPTGPAFVGVVADHVWQSTLVAGVAVTIALLLRRQPHVRHWVWFAVVVKFLVPFAVLVAIGHAIEWKQPSAFHSDLAVRVVETVGQPFSAQVFPSVERPSSTPLAPHSGTRWPQALLAIWVCGAACLALRWCVRWRRLARVAAAARPLAEGREIDALRRAQESASVDTLPVVSTDVVMEPGVFGIVRPVLIWPRDVSRHLDDAQMDAILLHELCHAKRRDNLVAMLLMLVQALFWFHPLVWWLGARLVEDRERACDDDVIRRGVEPSAYAEGLLRTCRFCVETPLACVAGVTGSDLRKRIEGIMQPRATTRVNRWTKSILGLAAAAVVAAPMVVGAMNARASSAPSMPVLQVRTITGWLGLLSSPRSSLDVAREILTDVAAPAGADVAKPAPVHAENAPAGAAQAPPPPPRSTVKASTMTPPIAPVPFTTSTDGRTMAGFGMTLRDLIRFAYAGSAGPLMKGQSTGGPDWVDTRRFDVIVMSPDSSPITLLRNDSGVVVGGTGLTLLQQVLAERFQLTVHSEKQNGRVYDLVSVNAVPGADLRKTTEVCSGSTLPCGFRSGPGFLAARGVTMEQLAFHLASQFPAIDRPVRNKTGLAGAFDITLSFTPAYLWSPQTGEPNVANPTAGAGPSLFLALEDRLGLKLQEKVDELDVTVVDSAGAPRLD